ncbi:tautomerase family protein [Soonwooa sp.]|uniref:tautomerase family protein n=1 Tax=Soonwooa sp. TaxID=1938592 RepID=UPI0026054612|nr:tautomerase family protein [Soonwooa sp.]
MPLVRISLSKSHSSETQDAISKAVHQALIEHFNIPADDYFHIIEALKQPKLKYPTTYLDVAHTDNIVFVQIIAAKGRTTEQKRNLYQKIAELIAQNTSIKTDDVIITLLENEKDNWSFGQGAIQSFNHI